MGSNLFDLTGKLALVTGATQGLGMAIAEGIGKSGATVVINGNSSQEKIDNAVAIFKSQGINAYGYRFNVTDEKAVVNAVAQIEKEVGSIDILVNNAGIIKRTALAEMEVEDFEQVIKVDLVSPFIVSKAVVKGMMERKAGKIINICSMMSELGRNTVGAYAAAKGGLKMLTQNMFASNARVVRRGITDYVDIERRDGRVLSRPVRAFRGDVETLRVTALGRR